VVHVGTLVALGCQRPFRGSASPGGANEQEVEVAVDLEEVVRTGTKRKSFALYTIVERAERNFWCRIGTGFVNRDGSFNLFFDALPVNGTAHLREVEATQTRRSEGAPAAREPLEEGEVEP